MEHEELMEHEKLWNAIFRLEKSERAYRERLGELDRRIAKLEALQWTDEEIDRLIGSGMLGHVDKGDDK